MNRVESGIEFPVLAPLQRVMLGDSLAEPQAGHHVEQVEIRFVAGVEEERVVEAWMETVARTEALRIAFVISNGEAHSREFVTPESVIHRNEPAPVDWQSWLVVDRKRTLLAGSAVPWRAVYWHDERRFIWTFHHALLDGRSIARVLKAFLKRVDGGEAEDLLISQWRGPAAGMLEVAARAFRDLAEVPQSRAMEFQQEPDAPAVRYLGSDFATRFESRAAELKVTTATLLIHAWGQALAEESGSDAVIVEQIRAGAPQDGTAGFSMNLLPVVIHRGESPQEVRTRLVALREIESVSPDDFSPGVYPNVDGPTSSVIMIERSTLRHATGSKSVESLVLHEAQGETLMATAYLEPELRLEVEGPRRHAWLAAWIGAMESF